MCKVNSICLKILVFLVYYYFFFALNAESSCLLSKLLCLSLFLLNIVSTWVMETHFLFIVMTLGTFVSIEGGIKGGRGGQVAIALKVGYVQMATPWHGSEEVAARGWVFLNSVA